MAADNDTTELLELTEENLAKLTPEQRSEIERTARTAPGAARRSLTALLGADQQAAEKPVQMFLPGFIKDKGAMPNHINRSSLFVPIARGRRKIHWQVPMVTRRDCVIEYTGQQLDEADADIVMALVRIASAYPLGELVAINRAELLKMIGRNTGKHDYDWLHKRLRALAAGSLYIEARDPGGRTKYRIGQAEVFRILQRLLYGGDEEAAQLYPGLDPHTYYVVIDPRWAKLFGGQEFALIDWDKRRQLSRDDLAKALQRLIATSSDNPQRYALDWLKAKMEYSGRMRDFRDALTRAVQELRHLEIIAKGSIEENTKGKPQLTLWIPVSG